MLALMGSASASSVRQSGISWRSDYAAAVSESEKSGKPLFLYFTTVWCGWCKVLERETFTDSNVGRQSAKYVAVKLDAEKEGKDLASKFKVSSYPTILLVKDDKLVGTIAGFMKPDEFVRRVDQVLSYDSDRSRLTAALKANPSDAAASAEMAVLLLADGKVDEAMKLRETAEKGGYSGPWMARIALDAGTYYAGRDPKKAAEWYEKSIAYGDPTYTNAAYEGLMMASFFLGDKEMSLSVAKRISGSEYVSDSLRTRGQNFLKSAKMESELRSPGNLLDALLKELQAREPGQRDDFFLTNLFTSEALIRQIGRGQMGTSYISIVREQLAKGMALDITKAKYKETSREITQRLHMAHALIGVEVESTLDGKARKSKGYISLQLYDQENRWYITSMTVEFEPGAGE